MKPSELRKYLFEETDRHMNAAGFAKYNAKTSHQFYTTPVAEGCTGIVVLRTYVHCGSLHFEFWVEARIEEVESLVERFLPRSPKDPNSLAPRGTISGNIWPKDQIDTYVPNTTKHIDQDLTVALEILNKFALPFFQKYSSLEAVYDASDNVGLDWASLPVILILMNQKQKALSLLESKFLGVGSQERLKFDQRKIFGQNLKQFIAELDSTVD